MKNENTMNRLKFRLCILFTLIVLTMSATSVHASTNAEFKKVWLEHGVTKNGQKGMVVHAKITIDGMKGKKVDAVAWIKDENGNYLKKWNGNNLYNEKRLNVTYENSVWEDVPIFIPYDDMDFKSGKHSYYALVSINSINGKCLYVSDDVEFTGTGSGGNSKTPNNVLHPALDFTVKDRVENADGSITSTLISKCTICHASGICNLCAGQGGKWGGYGAYARYVICGSCGGGGRCKYCGGTGNSQLVSTYYPATNESFGYNVHTGTPVSSNNYYNFDFLDSGTNNGGSHSKKATCSNCNGTGYDRLAYKAGDIRPYVGGYTHSSGGKCQYCGLYEWHQHVYCPFCQANKYP